MCLFFAAVGIVFFSMVVVAAVCLVVAMAVAAVVVAAAAAVAVVAVVAGLSVEATNSDANIESIAQLCVCAFQYVVWPRVSLHIGPSSVAVFFPVLRKEHTSTI